MTRPPTTLQAAVLLVPGDATINDHFGDALVAARKADRMRASSGTIAITFSDSDADEKATIQAQAEKRA